MRPTAVFTPNPRNHNLPSKASNVYKIKQALTKMLTFWIFPKVLRRQAKRCLRYYFGIDLKPESFIERRNYNRLQLHCREKYAETDFSAYKIISLGSDCLPRTIPTLWGIKPRKAQGEISCPFDLSNNPLPGIVKNMREDFADYFASLCYSGQYWQIPDTGILFCHDGDCGAEDESVIRSRFTRRINNLRNVLNASEPVVFISHFCKELNKISGNAAAELYNELYEILKQRRTGRPFRFLIVDYSRSVPKRRLKAEIKILAPEYLPLTYVWNYPEYRYSKLGLRFEKELIDTVAGLIAEMKPNSDIGTKR